MGDIVRTPQQLSHVLRAHRKQKGFTQKVAGEGVGLLPKTISALEQHADGSSLDSLFRLLSALNLELVIQEIPASRGPEGPEW
jgi:HTH-type transcriptional regulator/antitoxin HipB